MIASKYCCRDGHCSAQSISDGRVILGPLHYLAKFFIWDARNAIMVASQFASAARKDQQGVGAVSPPPMPTGMLVTSDSPLGSIALTRGPDSVVAVAKCPNLIW